MDNDTKPDRKTATTSNGRSGPEDQARSLLRESGRDAQDAMNASVHASVGTFDTQANMARHLSEQTVAMWTGGARQMVRLWADMFDGSMEAFGVSVRSWNAEPPALAGWQHLLDAGTRALGQFAEQAQASSEEGVERLKEAVDGVADQVKDNGSKFAASAQATTRNRQAAAR